MKASLGTPKAWGALVVDNWRPHSPERPPQVSTTESRPKKAPEGDESPRKLQQAIPQASYVRNPFIAGW